MSSIFTSLPLELVYEIFEHAAEADTATALAISLVSSWAKNLVEPMLYHTIILSTARAVTALHSTLLSKPSSFASARVKNLGIFAPGPVETIDKLIGACTGIDSLACGFSLPSYKRVHESGSDGGLVLEQCQTLKEQHLLGLSCRDGWDASVVRPSVTHLRVHITSPQRPWFPLPGANTTLDSSNWDLSYLPSLTHLAVVFCPTSAQPAESLLAPLQRLLGPDETSSRVENTPESLNEPHNDVTVVRPSKLSVVLIQVLGTKASQARAVEALDAAALTAAGSALRIVAEPAPLSAVSQWEMSVKTGKGVWDNAEQVVGRRLASAADARRSPRS